jgi:hypothetical protein
LGHTPVDVFAIIRPTPGSTLGRRRRLIIPLFLPFLPVFPTAIEIIKRHPRFVNLHDGHIAADHDGIVADQVLAPLQFLLPVELVAAPCPRLLVDAVGDRRYRLEVGLGAFVDGGEGGYLGGELIRGVAGVVQ